MFGAILVDIRRAKFVNEATVAMELHWDASSGDSDAPAGTRVLQGEVHLRSI